MQPRSCGLPPYDRIAFFSLNRDHTYGTDTHRPGAWKPLSKLSCAVVGASRNPLPLRSGSLWRMSRPLKLKAIGTVFRPVFPTPRPRVLGHVCGGAPQTFSPALDWRSMLFLSFITIPKLRSLQPGIVRPTIVILCLSAGLLSIRRSSCA
jgi:hypothetical protein